jgi:hypothetical protein
MIIVLLSLIVVSNRAQEVKKSKWIMGPSIGYQYQDISFLKASVWGLTDLGYANYVRFDAGANLAFQDKKAHIIPEVGITYYLGAKGVWPFIKTEITPYTVTPKFGLGLFNIVEVAAGYGFELQQKKNLVPIDGFNFSIGFSLPLNYHLD